MSRCLECENKIVTTEGDYFTCVICKGKCHYDSKCSGWAITTIKALSKKKKDEWTCKRCRKQRTNSANQDESEDGIEETTENTEELENWRSAIYRIEKTLKELLEVKPQIDKIGKILEGMEFIEQKYEEIKNENESIKKRLKVLEDKQEQIQKREKETTDLRTEINCVRQTQNENDQYSRNKNIEIFGVEVSKKESMKDIIHGLVEKMELKNFQDSDIEKAHRLPTKSKTRPETIVVQFKSRERRDEWIERKKNKITNNDIFGNGNNQRIYINEHLTPYYKDLMWRTKQAAKDTYKFIWYRGGKILLRKDEKERFVRTVKSDKDLDQLKREMNIQNGRPD